MQALIMITSILIIDKLMNELIHLYEYKVKDNSSCSYHFENKQRN